MGKKQNLPESIFRVKEKPGSEYDGENDREFYARFAERWARIYPGDEVRKRSNRSALIEYLKEVQKGEKQNGKEG